MAPLPLSVCAQLVKEKGKVLVLSDGSLLPFMAASLGASGVSGGVCVCDNW